MSSSVCCRLQALFTAAKTTTKPTAAKTLTALVEKFKISSDSSRSHKSYESTVRRLAATQKFSYIEDVLGHNIYYPKCPNPELTVGVGRHSDVSTLTMLLQDDVGGLYVRKRDTDDWIHVSPISGALVINVGDALQIMSNGRYKSIEHRVVANGSKNRISVPVFVNPRPSDIIGPLKEVVESTGEKPMYKQVLCSDYTRHFYKKPHNGKDTLDYAKI